MEGFGALKRSTSRSPWEIFLQAILILFFVCFFLPSSPFSLPPFSLSLPLPLFSFPFPFPLFPFPFPLFPSLFHFSLLSTPFYLNFFPQTQLKLIFLILPPWGCIQKNIQPCAKTMRSFAKNNSAKTIAATINCAQKTREILISESSALEVSLYHIIISCVTIN